MSGFAEEETPEGLRRRLPGDIARHTAKLCVRVRGEPYVHVTGVRKCEETRRGDLSVSLRGTVPAR